ncbi:MAG: M15 family metallopeptidase [Lachnospiraceae bacterium]|nr:M15 family metallopeptidase [Lachnospiraceae bacterium]
MEKKLHERIVDRLTGMSRRHPGCKLPVLVCIFVVLAVYHLGRSFRQRLPRFAAVLACIPVFLVCASFSTPEPLPELPGIPGDRLPAPELKHYEVTYAEEDGGDGSAAAETPESRPVQEGDERAPLAQEELIGAEELLADYSGNGEQESVYASDEELLAGFDPDDWHILLVNKQHPIPEDYSFVLGNLIGGLQCDSRVVEPLQAMFAGALRDGVTLYVRSPYRVHWAQLSNFNAKIERNMQAGMDYSEAYRKASQAVTIPGCSEHEIGLAFDIVTGSYGVLDAGFGQTTAGKWLKEHCSEYGFILRYPEGKEDITGIEFEPWHFRYVGRDAASYITAHDLTLEEFTELIRER